MGATTEGVIIEGLTTGGFTIGATS